MSNNSYLSVLVSHVHDFKGFCGLFLYCTQNFNNLLLLWLYIGPSVSMGNPFQTCCHRYQIWWIMKSTRICRAAIIFLKAMLSLSDVSWPPGLLDKIGRWFWEVLQCPLAVGLSIWRYSDSQIRRTHCIFSLKMCY